MSIQKTIVMAIVATLCGFVSSVAVADDLFLKIDGVPGESVDKLHPNEIVLESYKTGVVQSKTRRGEVNAEATEFTAVAYTNSASPTLYAMAANGTRIASIVLSVRGQSGKSPIDYLKITLRNALVTSVNLGGEAGSERASDTYSFGGYSEIEVEYMPVGPGGEPGAPVQGGWDISQNAKK